MIPPIILAEESITVAQGATKRLSSVKYGGMPSAQRALVTIVGTGKFGFITALHTTTGMVLQLTSYEEIQNFLYEATADSTITVTYYTR